MMSKEIPREFRITDYEIVLLALEECGFSHDCKLGNPGMPPYTGEIRNPNGELIAYMTNGEHLLRMNHYRKDLIPQFRLIETALKGIDQYRPVFPTSE